MVETDQFSRMELTPIILAFLPLVITIKRKQVLNKKGIKKT